MRAVALDAGASARAFAAAGVLASRANHVLMNPPFNDPARQNNSPDQHRRRAHAAPPGLLSRWISTASRLLQPSGAVTLIWRADGLDLVIAALKPKFGGLAILPVHGMPDQKAIRVLVRATKGSNAPLSLLPGLILNDKKGQPTGEAEEVLRNAKPLALAGS
jgi:tRNA1(Val) A37 N6-methylase TrmN6